MKKATLLRVAEFFSLFAFLSVRIFVKYYELDRWAGVVMAVLFAALYGVLWFKRRNLSIQRFLIELAIGIPMILLYLYVAFFLR